MEDHVQHKKCHTAIMAIRRPSSSTFSVFKKEFLESLLWERHGGTLLTASPEIYDLCRLVQVGGEGKKGESDRLAYEYIAKHLTKYSVEVKLGCEVQLFKDQLSPLLTSTVIKPDVAIYCDNFPLMFFEVHSSPYECTLIKCIVTVTEQIRLHHLYDNTSQNITYTGFTFPKIGSKRCVAKVAVMWQEFKFKYTVEFLENPDNVASLVEKAVQKQLKIHLILNVNNCNHPWV